MAGEMIIIKMLAAVAGGLAAHSFYEPSLALKERWGTLARYALGVIVGLPFVVLIKPDIRTKSDSEDTAVSYLLAMIGVGIGAFLGHMIDRYSHE